LASDFAVTQWTRDTLQLGRPVVDTFLQYCGYTHRVTQAGLDLNGDCKCGHVVLDRVAVPRPLGDYTFRELARLADFEGSALDSLSLTVGGARYVGSAVCRCGGLNVDRFVRVGSTLGRCATCGVEVTPQPFYTSRPTPGGDLNSQRDRPLKEIGGGSEAWAVLQCGERGVLLRTASCEKSTAADARETDR
jgi:hypothetical protein